MGSKKGIGYKISRFVLAFDRYQKYCHFAKYRENKLIKKIKICILIKLVFIFVFV